MTESVVETRRLILAAAKREFAEKGFDGARMGSIARRAQVNQALIHYYFGTKDNLYSEVLNWVFGVDFVREIDLLDEMKRWTLSPAELLYIMIYISVHVHLEAVDEDSHPLLARERAEGSRFLRPILKDFLIPRLLLAENIIKLGVEQGVFDTDNTLLVVMEFINFISSYAAQKTIYHDTEIYARIYEEYDINRFFLHVVTNMLKILTPVGKIIEVPRMKPEVMDYIDDVIRTIREKQNDLMKSCPLPEK